MTDVGDDRAASRIKYSSPIGCFEPNALAASDQDWLSTWDERKARCIHEQRLRKSPSSGRGHGSLKECAI